MAPKPRKAPDMPTVPIYRQQVTTARAPDTRLGVRATPDSFGGAVAEGVQAAARGIASASSSVDQIAAKERQRANQIAIDEAKSKLETQLSPKLAKARTTRGKEAVGVGDTLLPEYDGLAEEVTKGLTTDEQRLAFKAYTLDRKVGIRRELDNHAAQGMQQYDDQVFAANGEVLSNRLAGVYQDRREVALAVGERVKEIADYADRNGLPPEWRTTQIRAMQSGAARQVITAHMDAGNDLAAQKSLDLYKPFLTEKDASYAARLVEDGSSKNEGQRQGMAIYQPGQSLEDAFAAADQIASPRVRQETKNWLQEKHTLAVRAAQQDQDRLFQDTYQEAMKSPMGLRAIPESRLQLLDLGNRERLESALKRETAGVKLPWQESKGRRYEIESALADPKKRAEILQRGAGIFLGLMNEDDQNAVAATIKELREGKVDSASWLNSREDKINQALAVQGLDPRPYVTAGGATKPNPQAIAFRSAVETEANVIAQANKRTTPNGDDVQKAIDGVMLRKVRVDTNWWRDDPERVAATLSQDEKGEAYVPIADIPANFNADIQSEIASRSGKPATEDQIQRAYAAALIGDRAMYDRILAGE
jgi:hypothetical protein